MYHVNIRVGDGFWWLFKDISKFREFLNKDVLVKTKKSSGRNIYIPESLRLYKHRGRDSEFRFSSVNI